MTVTEYMWDPVSDNVLMESDENGDTTAEYTNEPRQFGELVSQRRDGATSTYHFDGEFSTRQLTDEVESVTDSATYSAFGEEVSHAGSALNPFGFGGAIGYFANPAAENLLVRNRYYLPAIARWASVDPLPLIDGPNGYAYVSNNPLLYIDATGLVRTVHAWKEVEFYLESTNAYFDWNPANSIGGLPSIRGDLRGQSEDDCTFVSVSDSIKATGRLLFFKQVSESRVIRDTVSHKDCCGGLECARKVGVGFWSATKLTLIPIPTAKLWQFAAQAILKFVINKPLSRLIGTHLVAKVSLTICANGSYRAEYDTAMHRAKGWDYRTDGIDPSVSRPPPPAIPAIEEENVVEPTKK